MQYFKLIIFGIFCLVGITACTKDAQTFKPLGSYLWDYKIWRAADSLSIPSDTVFLGRSITFTADDSLSNPLVVEVPSGYFLQPRYVLQFNDMGGGSYKLSSVSLNQDDWNKDNF